MNIVSEFFYKGSVNDKRNAWPFMPVRRKLKQWWMNSLCQPYRSGIDSPELSSGRNRAVLFHSTLLYQNFAAKSQRGEDQD